MGWKTNVMTLMSWDLENVMRFIFSGIGSVTWVFFMFIQSPFTFHVSLPCLDSSWVSAISSRLLAYRSSNDTPIRNSLKSASSIRMTNSGLTILITEHTTPGTGLHMPWMTRTAHPSTLRLLKAHNACHKPLQEIEYMEFIAFPNQLSSEMCTIYIAI